MADPSGSTAWEYDARWRVTKETKVISGTGGGTFVTQWTAHDAMDRVRTMIYPDGESVTFSYMSQGPIKAVYANSTYCSTAATRTATCGGARRGPAPPPTATTPRTG